MARNRFLALARTKRWEQNLQGRTTLSYSSRIQRGGKVSIMSPTGEILKPASRKETYRDEREPNASVTNNIYELFLLPSTEEYRLAWKIYLEYHSQTKVISEPIDQDVEEEHGVVI